jgi:hypothetical protein
MKRLFVCLIWWLKKSMARLPFLGVFLLKTNGQAHRENLSFGSSAIWYAKRQLDPSLSVTHYQRVGFIETLKSLSRLATLASRKEHNDSRYWKEEFFLNSTGCERGSDLPIDADISEGL